jgi:type III secretory pathway component EscT
MKLTAGDMMVIVDTLNKSLKIMNYEGFTDTTRERVRDHVLNMMSQIEVEVVCGNVEPVMISGDVGG